MSNVNQGRHARLRISSLIGASLIVLVVGTAPALGDLSQTDLSAISANVQSALAGAAQGGPTALADAVKTATTSALGMYGAQNGPQVAAAIIADALADGAPPQAVGQGMAAAALGIGAPGSNTIADAVGGSGGADVLAAFDAALAGTPGGEALIAEADAAANKRTASALGITVGGGIGVGVGVGGGFCVNASCN